MTMNIHPIATIRTPFSEKFAIPRQANIIKQAVGHVYLQDAYRQAESLDGLAAHSHYWLIWGFHQHVDKNKTLTVRPPRLGGNMRVGVFSTRSPFRPNNLGLSVVKLERLDRENFSLIVSGVDMLDNSPIYDIKPYIPYADACLDAHSEWANQPPTPRFTVEFLPTVKTALHAYDEQHHTQLLSLLTELLRYDARPAYKANREKDDKTYATTLYGLNITWNIVGERVMVTSVSSF